MAVVFYDIEPDKTCNKYPKEIESRVSERCLYTHFHSGIIQLAMVEGVNNG